MRGNRTWLGQHRVKERREYLAREGKAYVEFLRLRVVEAVCQICGARRKWGEKLGPWEWLNAHLNEHSEPTQATITVTKRSGLGTHRD